MKFLSLSTSLGLLLPILQATANAQPANLQNEKRGTELHEAPRRKYITLNAHKQNRNPGEYYYKRDGSDDQAYQDITVGNWRDDLYFVDLEVGSNKQKVTVQLDTGSADLWLFSDENKYCGYNPNNVQGIANCEKYGVYDFQSSDTFHLNQSLLFISYGDTTTAKGVMGTDDVILFPNNGGDGELTIQDVSLGVISLSNSSNPVMGVGFKALQSVVDYNLQQVEYDSLPYQMANQDLINIPAYSISILTNKTIANSSITFGAIDNTRFTGDLSVFPVPYPQGKNEPVYVSIVLNRITLDDDTELASGSAYAILDTGCSESYFPEDIIRAIGSTYFQYDSTYDIYYSKCQRLYGTNINFEFSGVSYTVPLTQFVETADDYFVVDHDQFSGQCIFNVESTGDDMFMLGDSFLRSVYMVVDLENGEVGLASISLVFKLLVMTVVSITLN
ncbi:unnamed protein product [Ambrosiozyma monospora]|uniref:Unnamed protein product n=1 Tax=Ambrosiozyma monospora TaxID=43982 RepID=A0ACB5TR55_AMBMO|nr:unnamed protein product [Ambrosiozyma monospora]